MMNIHSLPMENPSYVVYSVFIVCPVTHFCTFTNYSLLRKLDLNTGNNPGVITVGLKS